MTPEETNTIISRFCEAIDYLKETKQIRGLQTFTRRYGIPRTTLYHATAETFKAAWLVYLVRDYGINANWLLTGEGKMHG